MERKPNHPAAACLAAALLAGCGEASKLPDQADVGPRPTLTAPNKTLLPTVHIAPALPWPPGQAPQAAAGLQVSAYAIGLSHPRWLHVLPNGDVLVAETNAPPRPESAKGIKGWIMKLVMARAGAATPSANRITLLRDADGDGLPETRTAFLENLNSPFGMAQVGDSFYVANADAVMEYAYVPGELRIQGAGRKLTDLPGGPRNHHWTKALIASPDGSKLYATVGSNSNVAEHGMQEEEGRAAIWEIDRATGAKRLYATGLRNPNGMAWIGEGTQTTLWTVVNERDEIGSDLVPDYLTSVREGAFYGWPYSWFGNHLDERVRPQQPQLVARAVVPDYALGSHVAPLGLAASGSSPLPGVLTRRSIQPHASVQAVATVPAPAPSSSTVASSPTQAQTGVFIGLHGSWNRKPLSGYKVIYVPFAGGRPHGMPHDVLTGFVNAEGKANGRPVGVAIDSRGALLVADDVGNAVWRVVPAR
ncbi:MAG TPA: sorbosone dehydrogenase family protein [Rubrivivax sp.]|nr:sorbosone dehydrogenase family protein [Rubrivivax sp.]